MATKVGQKFKCSICGNEVVVTNSGQGELVCCRQPMEVIGDGFQCNANRTAKNPLKQS